MTITFVGSNTGQNTAPTGVTVALPATNQNDLVLVITGTPDRGTGVGAPATSGYTTLVELMPTAPELAKLHISRKFMGATPDPSVTIGGGAQVATCILAFRGVDTTTPIDVTLTTVLLSVSPNPSAITPASNNCCIVAAGYSIQLDTSVGSITNYLPSPSVQKTCNIDTTVAAVYRILSGGASVAEDPLPWSTWSTGSQRCMTATIALRPQAIEFVTVDKATVTATKPTVPVLGTVPVQSATTTITGKTIATPDGLVESIFVDPAMDIMLVGKTVDSTETFRAVTVTQAAVLYRGRTVTPRDIQFEDIPRYAVRGRGSGHWMETR